MFRRLFVLLAVVALAGLSDSPAKASNHDFEIEAEVPKEVGKGANGSIVVKFRYQKKGYRGSAPIDSGMTRAEKAKAVKDAIDGAKSLTGQKPVGVTATVNGDKVELYASGADRLSLKSVKLSESDTITGISRNLFGQEESRKELSYRFFEEVVESYLARVGITTYLGTVSHAALLAIGLVPQSDPGDAGWVATKDVYPYDPPLTVFGDG